MKKWIGLGIGNAIGVTLFYFGFWEGVGWASNIYVFLLYFSLIISFFVALFSKSDEDFIQYVPEYYKEVNMVIDVIFALIFSGMGYFWYATMHVLMGMFQSVYKKVDNA